MKKNLFTSVLLAVTVCLLFASLASAADYNYYEIVGNVVSQEVTRNSSNTITRITLSIRTDDRGSQIIKVDCPLASTALHNLCLDTATLVDCPSYGTTGGDSPTTSGVQCQPGYVGRCVWGWGYMQNATGGLQLPLDALFTRQSTACTAK
jgi:hypothetical protein